jgi:carbohydrate diacid regulator
MLLSAQSAQQIAYEISSIVKQHVNIMDENGYIIASTDPKRIGDFHAGAKKIIDEHLDEFYVKKEDETSSTRAGLNLPININGNIIGVVGITGEYEQVYNYGQIVRKMTEILVRESYAQNQERLDKKIENRFLEDWILGNGMESGQSFVERGLALHIDILRPRRAMVLRLENFQTLSATNDGQKIIEKVEKSVRQFICSEPNQVFLRLTTKQVCLVTPRDDQQMVQLAQTLICQIRESCHVELLIGIDDNPDGTLDVKTAYLKANKASHASRISHPVTLYSQMTTEIFLEEIPRAVKREYLQKVFPGLHSSEIRHWIHLLGIYFESDGSIKRSSEKLFMHKNTLQYKLKKLAAITGYDIRLPRNCAIFFIAIQFFHDLQDEYGSLEL